MNWNAKNNLFPIAVFLLAIVVLAGCAKKEADTQDFDPARLLEKKPCNNGFNGGLLQVLILWQLLLLAYHR